nr:unnamed protein product [Callosobruchus chinensis]
MYVASWSTMF